MAARQEAEQVVSYSQPGLASRLFKSVRTFVVRKPLGAVGALIILLMLAMAILARL